MATGRPRLVSSVRCRPASALPDGQAIAADVPDARPSSTPYAGPDRRPLGSGSPRQQADRPGRRAGGPPRPGSVESTGGPTATSRRRPATATQAPAWRTRTTADVRWTRSGVATEAHGRGAGQGDHAPMTSTAGVIVRRPADGMSQESDQDRDCRATPHTRMVVHVDDGSEQRRPALGSRSRARDCARRTDRNSDRADGS